MMQVPHLCQRMNPKTKATCRKLYKKFKYGGIGVGYSALIAEEGKQLVVDINQQELSCWFISTFPNSGLVFICLYQF
jgi:hypothetical protein